MSICQRCLNKLTKFYIKNNFSTTCISAGREISLFQDDHKNLLKVRPKFDENLKSLRIAIIGAPNAGKSLLTNQLVAWKFAPVSSKVHTTRAKMIGVHTEGNNQLIFMDTPGIIQPSSLKKHNLERSLLVDPHVALFDSHLIAVVVDVSHIWHRMRLETNVLQLLEYHKDKPSILILNKVDLLKKKSELLEVGRRLSNGRLNNQPYINAFSSKTLSANDIIHNFKLSISKPNTTNSDINYSLTNQIDKEDDILLNGEDKIVKQNVYNSKHNITAVKNLIDTFNSQFNSQPTSNHFNNSNDIGTSIESENTIKKSSELYDPEKWNEYYLALKNLGSKHQNGWSHFSEIFMISALTGDGILELKNYLSSKTFKSKWEYGPSVVTNIGPLQLAKLCVREKILEYVPNDVAYCVEIRKIIWEISDDNFLKARFDIICKRKRQASLIMGPNGSVIQKISREAKQSLMNAFRREMTLQLIVKCYEEK